MAKTVLVDVQEKNNQVCMSKSKFEALINEFESLIETIEVLSDPDMVKQIKESEKQIKAGKIIEIRKKGDLIKQISG